MTRQRPIQFIKVEIAALDALAAELGKLAPSNRDPERFHVQKSELIGRIRALARHAEQADTPPPGASSDKPQAKVLAAGPYRRPRRFISETEKLRRRDAARLARKARSRKADRRATEIANILMAIYDSGDHPSLHDMARKLTARGIPTPAGKQGWTATQVWRVIGRVVSPSQPTKDNPKPPVAVANEQRLAEGLAQQGLSPREIAAQIAKNLLREGLSFAETARRLNLVDLRTSRNLQWSGQAIARLVGRYITITRALDSS